MLPRLFPAVLPICALLAYWGGGEYLLLATAVAAPLLFMVSNRGNDAASKVSLDHLTGLPSRGHFETELAAILKNMEEYGTKTACFMVQVDEFHEIANRYGDSASERALRSMAQRLKLAIRDSDSLARTGDSRFAIVLGDVRHLDLEVCIQLASRLQAAVEEPVQLDGMNIYASCCVGFCLSMRASEPTPGALMKATEIALAEAQRHAPSAIRAYSSDMELRAVSRQKLLGEACKALDKNQLRAWFQPQVSTDTGEITGFESLVRWEHPQRGVLPPAEFIEVLEKAGQLERLGETMLDQAFSALKTWDEAGYTVPHIGVNFTKDELRNPKLVDRIAWKLDRFELSPDRLSVEVLETVVADSPDDTVARNINGLAALGCRVDLDDFGTGHASISSIRRFTVSRLKIDRSFVMKADQDPDQQRMIHAIITMAERLGLETLAEGVETAGEHSILAQLGCEHVQGYGIARPMPFEDTIPWMQMHSSKLQSTPRIGRKTG